MNDIEQILKDNGGLINHIAGMASHSTDQRIEIEQMIRVHAVLKMRNRELRDTPAKYLARLARNVIIDNIRHEQLRRGTTVELERFPHDSNIFRYEPTLAVDDRMAAKAALARLDPFDRETLQVFIEHDESVENSAEAMNLSYSAFKSRLYRARARARRVFNDPR